MIVVIGAGPAGIMAALQAAKTHPEVTLVEKNKHLGRKLLLTGGGRCNLTNACNPEELLLHFSKTGSFLRNAFYAFDNTALISYFDKRGLSTKVEEEKKVFPVTDKASSVLDVLEADLRKRKVRILVTTSLSRISIAQNEVKEVICKNGTRIKATAIILATGGLSYAKTGSTGDGIQIAEKLGHTIIPLRPGLVGLPLKSALPKRLEGLPLPTVRLTFKSGKQKITTKQGSILFTKNGISGPLVLSSSAKVIDWLNEAKNVILEIDTLPALEYNNAKTLILQRIAQSPSKAPHTLLKEFVPARLANVLLECCDIPRATKVNQLTSQKRNDILNLLKRLSIPLSNTVSFKKAQITRGGISTQELDPKTMASKKVQGLYFAGEMIDIDGGCGGFNLQAAFSTGYVAGTSAANK